MKPLKILLIIMISSIISHSFGEAHAAPIDLEEKCLIALTHIDSLYKNLSRQERLYLEENTDDNTPIHQWGYTATIQELINSYPTLLSLRRELASQSGEALRKKLKARYLFNLDWGGKEETSLYKVLLETLLQCHYSLHEATQRTPIDFSAIFSWQSLVTEEVNAACQAGLYNEALYLAQQASPIQGDNKKWLQTVRPAFGKQSQGYEIEAEILKLGSLEEARKLFTTWSHNPTEAHAEAWRTVDKQVQTAWQKLLKQCPSLAQRESEFAYEKFRIQATLSDPIHQKATLTLVGISRAPIRLERAHYRENHQKALGRKSIPIQAKESELIRYTLTDSLEEAAHYIYSISGKHQKEHAALRYNQIEANLYQNDNEAWVYLCDLATGKPIPQKQLTLETTSGSKGGFSQKRNQKVVHTDANGFYHIEKKSDVWHYLTLEDNRLADKRKELYVPDRPRKVTPRKNNIAIYPDRPLYKYGDTVQVGIVSLLHSKKDKTQTDPGATGSLSLYAYNELDKVKLATATYHTNNYGVGQISFQLPIDEKYSDFYIEEDTDKSPLHSPLDVQAYKRNYLTVTLDEITHGLVQGKPAHLTLSTQDLNGLATPSLVTISYQAANGPHSITLSSSGKTTVETLPLGSYTQFTIEATDALGNVATTYYRRRCDSSSMPLNAQIALEGVQHQVLHKAHATLSLSTQPYNQGIKRNLSDRVITAELINPEGASFALGTFAPLEKRELQLTTLPSGIYRLRLATTDHYGKITTDVSKPFYLFDDNDPTIQADAIPLFVWQDSASQIRIASTQPRQVLLWVSNENTVLLRKLISIDSTIQTIPIAVTTPSGSHLEAKIQYTHQGRILSRWLDLSKGSQQPHLNTAVSFAAQTLRPNQKVKGTIHVTNEKGEPVNEARIIISVYDQAVQNAAIEGHPWMLILKQAEESYEDGIGAIPEALQNAPLALTQAKGVIPSESSSPILRSNFQETAYFNATLLTNSEGVADVEFTLPSTQTEYCIITYAFNETFEREVFEEAQCNAFLPLSIEIGLPRYLHAGDTLLGEAQIRNQSDTLQNIQYYLATGNTLLAQDSIALSTSQIHKVSFTLPTNGISEGSLSINAQLHSATEQDAIQKEIPIRRAEVDYPIATPLTWLGTNSGTLSLPEVQSATQEVQLELYLNPQNLAWSQLAQAYHQEDSTTQPDFFSTLAQYVIYNRCYALLQSNPQKIAELQETQKLLTTYDTPPSKQIERQASPKQLATFYHFISDLETVKNHVAKMEDLILQKERPNQGFSLSQSHTSPYLTFWILSQLGKVEPTLLSPRMREAIQQSIAYLDKLIVDATQEYSVLLPLYFTSRLQLLGEKPQKKSLKSLIQKELQEGIQQYIHYYPSQLIDFALFVHYYGSASQNREVDDFIRERKPYALNDRETLAYSLYLYRDAQQLPQEVINFLLRHKQATTLWDDAFSLDAMLSLIKQIAPTEISDQASLQIDQQHFPLSPEERATGQICRFISPTKETLTLTLHRVKSEAILGGIVYHVKEPFAQVEPQGSALQVDKEIFVERVEQGKKKLLRIDAEHPAHKGETLLIRYNISCDRDLSLVRLIDERPAGAEPGYDFDGYCFSERLLWFYTRREAQDHIYIDYLPKGLHTLEMRATANVAGIFSYGPVSIKSYYAAEFAGNSSSGVLHTIIPHP